MSNFLGAQDGLLAAEEDRQSFVSVASVAPGPDTLTKLVRRLRALILELLPVEVDPSSISEPTSRVTTPQVVAAFRAAAGDFVEALPYCLLRAHAEFMWDTNHNPADYGENLGRAIACEVLARRLVRTFNPSRVPTIMSTRYMHRQIDGDESEMASALELAIDQHCTIFLSSSESREVVNALWNGELIQRNNEKHDIEYIPYAELRDNSFWGHLDVSRLSVPRYQNMFRIVIWLFFLGVYSQAVREPLDKLNPDRTSFDKWEIILYFMSLSFVVEDIYKFFQIIKFTTFKAFSFWNTVAFITDGLLCAAFVLRIMGIHGNAEQQILYRLRSFQVLSWVAPFIWMKLITVFDGYKYIGTMQICVARMLKESGIFFALLSVLAIGFTQGLYALDAADGTAEEPMEVVNVLIQALLQAPDYARFEATPSGLWLYYLWSAITAIVLLNVLISLFSSAYSDVVEDAEAQYLAFFAGKTVGMIRAPDSYVYPAPFNLIEVLLVAPFELIPGFRLSDKHYAQLNRLVMGSLFFVPLTGIALFESRFTRSKPDGWLKNWWRSDDEGAVADSPANRNPTVNDPACEGLEISRVPWEELVSVFPNTQLSEEDNILKHIGALQKQIEALQKVVLEQQKEKEV